MRVILTNFGTRGDFEPLIALAEELLSGGHEPIFAITSSAVEYISATGFKIIVIGTDIPRIQETINLFWSTDSDAYTASSKLSDLLSPFHSIFNSACMGLIEACRGASVLISGPAQPLGRIVHELIGIPFVSVQFSHFGGSGGLAIREAGEDLVNSFRRKVGLPPVSDPLTVGANSPLLSLYAMSRHLRPRPLDWPAHYYLTGFFYRNPPFSPSMALQNFIASSESTIAFSLGSMPHADISMLRHAISDALEGASNKAVVFGLGHFNDPNIFSASDIPHSWLFPLMRCAIIHGGAGTAAAAFRSGTPAIFVPHGSSYDQQYWAELAFEAHYSLAAVSLSTLDGRTLSDAIQKTLQAEDLQRNVMDLSHKIHGEDGVANARKHIERLVVQLGFD